LISCLFFPLSQLLKMSHKANCIQNAKDFLHQSQLSYIFSISIFERYYRTNNGSSSNAYTVGLNSADMMINEANSAYNFLADENENSFNR